MGMKKKAGSLAIATALLVSMLAGCGGQASGTGGSTGGGAAPAPTEAGEPQQTITIEFFQQKGEEGPMKGYQTIIDNFNAEYPHIKVEMNTVPDPVKVLTSRVASNDIPPIFTDFPTQMQFQQKVDNGFLLPVTGQDFLSRVNQSALDMSVADDGGYYALPYSNNFYGIYYNKDLFAEYNVEIPTTYAGLIAAFQVFQDAGITPIGIASKDPGQVGHMFQGMNVAFMAEGFETISKVIAGEASLAESAEYYTFAEKMREIFSYANDDALGISHNIMWENFANGKYAMAMTGSYARGTILIANPDLNMGIFPIPNDTPETTNILSGIDSAVCVSGMGTEAEKEAGLLFLEFLSRTEQAQIFCDNDGAPSCITEVNYKDEGVQPVIDLIQSGQVHDWAASTIDSNVVTDLYNVTQGFLMNGDIEQYLKDMDTSIAVNSAS